MRGQRGMRGAANNRWSQQQAKPMQVLSKAQKNKERERQRQVRKWQQQQRARQSNFHRPNQLKQRESSVTVRPDWIVLEEMDKSQLQKLSLPSVSEPEDQMKCGTMEYYEKTYDRVNVKSERQ